MKIYKLPLLAEQSPGNVYRLGREEIHTDAVDLLYGRLRPGETGRTVVAPPDREEIICVLKGRVRVRCARSAFTAGTGEAFYVKEGAVFTFDNPDNAEAVYIIAGGRADLTAARKKTAAPPLAPEAVAQSQPAQIDREETEYDITKDDPDTVD